jgi:DNA mismatch repair protein MutS
VDFSPSEGTLVYHRKLIPGIGEKLYGVEVAKFLLDKKSFVDQCFTTRQQLLQGASSESESELVVSRYNSKLVGVHCEICQKTKSYPGELHTHHIQEQHTANSDGLIGHIHKNNKSNLVILCSRHHRMVHNGEILIKGWTDSPSLGRQLNWSEVS